MAKTQRSARGESAPRQPRQIPPQGAATTDKPGRRPPRSGKVDRPASIKPRRQFVEPYPYTAQQRDAIDRSLAACGLGDETAREIFIGAIAYDLAVLEAALTAPPAPGRDKSPDAESARATPKAPVQPMVPEGLARQTQALGQTLDDLKAPARARLLSALAASDPFRRNYGPDYLAALRLELLRLGDAIESIGDASESPPGSTEPPAKAPPAAATTANAAKGRGRQPATDAREQSMVAFVRHVASVYEQCFDSTPDAAPDAPLARMLRAVAEATGISIASDAQLLRRTLARR